MDKEKNTKSPNTMLCTRSSTRITRRTSLVRTNKLEISNLKSEQDVNVEAVKQKENSPTKRKIEELSSESESCNEGDNHPLVCDKTEKPSEIKTQESASESENDVRDPALPCGTSQNKDTKISNFEALEDKEKKIDIPKISRRSLLVRTNKLEISSLKCEDDVNVEEVKKQKSVKRKIEQLSLGTDSSESCGDSDKPTLASNMIEKLDEVNMEESSSVGDTVLTCDTVQRNNTAKDPVMVPNLKLPEEKFEEIRIKGQEVHKVTKSLLIQARTRKLEVLLSKCDVDINEVKKGKSNKRKINDVSSKIKMCKNNEKLTTACDSDEKSDEINIEDSSTVIENYDTREIAFNKIAQREDTDNNTMETPDLDIKKRKYIENSDDEFNNDENSDIADILGINDTSYMSELTFEDENVHDITENIDINDDVFTETININDAGLDLNSILLNISEEDAVNSEKLKNLPDSSLSKKNSVVNSTTLQSTLENFKEDYICQFIILLKMDIVKAVVGVNGEAVVKLQNDTNSEIRISEKLKYFPGSYDRACSITGTVDAVLLALFFIIDIKKAKSSRGSDVQMEFVVPDRTARLIIGEKEENIQQIKKKSKAYMRMYIKTNYLSPNVSCFVVRSYNVDYIKTAFSLIFEYIALDLESGTFSNIAFPSVSFHAASSASFLETIVDEAPKIEDSLLQKKNDIADSDTSQLTQENSWMDKFSNLKILLESDIADTVTVVIQKLQEDSNSIVKIFKEFKYFRNTSRQECLIAGTAGAVLKAVYFIIDIKEVMLDGGNEVQVEIVVPDSTARLIMDEKENIIQQIKIKSKANMQVCNKKDYPSSNESCIAVKSDDVENIKTSFSLILEYIITNPESNTRSNVSCLEVSYNKSINRYGSSEVPSSSAADQEIHDWSSQNFGHQMNESYFKRAAGSNGYNYNYSVTGEYPVPISKRASNYPSENHEVSDYESRSKVASGYPVGDNQMSSLLPSDDFGYEYENHLYRYRRSSPRTDDKFTHHHSNNIGDEFSVIGALNLLERVCDKCEVLSGLIKCFTTTVKSELKIDRRKALRLIEEDNNILLLRMTVNKLESCFASAPLKELEMLSKAVKWTNYLIEYVKKGENSERNINLRAITYTRTKSSGGSDSRDRDCRSRHRRSSPSRTDDKFTHHDSNTIGDEFSVIGAMNLLERVCDNCGVLSEPIKAFTTSIKSELKIDQSKALRLFEDSNNILLLRMTANKLESCIASAPLEEIGMLSKAVEWINYLVEKGKILEKNINLRSITYSRSRSRTRSSRSDSRDREGRRYRRSSPRTDDKFTHHDSNTIGNEFSVIGALNHLERVCNKCGVLSESIKAFTTSIKSELKIDGSKAQGIIKDYHNILLLRMTVNKLESCIASAPLEEIGMLSKAVEWTKYLIEYIEKT